MTRYLTFTKENREQLMQLYYEGYTPYALIKHKESVDMLVREGFALRVGEFYRLTTVGTTIAKINEENENEQTAAAV